MSTNPPSEREKPPAWAVKAAEEEAKVVINLLNMHGIPVTKQEKMRTILVEEYTAIIARHAPVPARFEGLTHWFKADAPPELVERLRQQLEHGRTHNLCLDNDFADYQGRRKDMVLEVVPADFARSLERQLAEVYKYHMEDQAQLAASTAALTELRERAARLEEQVENQACCIRDVATPANVREMRMLTELDQLRAALAQAQEEVKVLRESQHIDDLLAQATREREEAHRALEFGQQANRELVAENDNLRHEIAQDQEQIVAAQRERDEAQKEARIATLAFDMVGNSPPPNKADIDWAMKQAINDLDTRNLALRAEADALRACLAKKDEALAELTLHVGGSVLGSMSEKEIKDSYSALDKAHDLAERALALTPADCRAGDAARKGET